MDKDSVDKKDEKILAKRMPENYLAFAMICTIVCFAPVGIFALYSSLRVNQLWEEKKFLKARKASKITRAICFCTIVAGVIFWIGILSGAFFNIFGYKIHIGK